MSGRQRRIEIMQILEPEKCGFESQFWHWPAMQTCRNQRTFLSLSFIICKLDLITLLHRVIWGLAIVYIRCVAWSSLRQWGGVRVPDTEAYFRAYITGQCPHSFVPSMSWALGHLPSPHPHDRSSVQWLSWWHRLSWTLSASEWGSYWTPLTQVVLGMKVRWPQDVNNRLVWGWKAISRNVKRRLNSCGKYSWNILLLFLEEKEHSPQIVEVEISTLL